MFPGDYETLLSLPGIGEYTAGAISFHRLRAIRPGRGRQRPAGAGPPAAKLAEITDPRKKPAFQRAARRMIPADARGGFQSGPHGAGGRGLPAERRAAVRGMSACLLCRARAAGCEEELPQKGGEKQRRMEKQTVLLVLSGGRVLLHKRGKGLLAGLWEYLLLPGRLSEREAQDELERRGFPVGQLLPLPDSRHIFTHIEWEMEGFAAFVEEGSCPPDCVWASQEQVRGDFRPARRFPGLYKELPRLLAQSAGR